MSFSEDALWFENGSWVGLGCVRPDASIDSGSFVERMQ
jgi:hypothetical protein